MNILVLCSENLDEGSKKFYPADIGIINCLKRLNHNVTVDFFPTQIENFSNFDIVFNLYDGCEINEESLLPTFFEDKDILCTGNPSDVISNCADKLKLKSILRKNHISTPGFSLLQNYEMLDFDYPIILKPRFSHASEGIDEDCVVFDERRLKKKLSKLNGCEMFAETYLPGREFCVPLIGNSSPLVLPILEIDFDDEYFYTKAKILSYKAKWSRNSNAYKNTFSNIAKGLNPWLERRIERIAKATFSALNCKGYATVDIRTDEYDNIFVIDVNPNPYLSPESDIAKAAAAIGISYEDLLERIIKLGVERNLQISVDEAKV